MIEREWASCIHFHDKFIMLSNFFQNLDEPVLKNPMIKQMGTEVSMGKDRENPLWGWDNEYGSSLVK